MDEIVKYKSMYLDHLLKQLINHKSYKGDMYKDDAPAITKKLLSDLDTILKEVEAEVTTNSKGVIGEKYYNGKAIKYEHEDNWKLMRQLDHLLFIKAKILEECAEDVPDSMLSQRSDSMLMSVGGSFLTQNSAPPSSHSEQGDLAQEREQDDEDFFDYNKKVLRPLRELKDSFSKDGQMTGMAETKAATDFESTMIDQEETKDKTPKKSKNKYKWLPVQLGAVGAVAGLVGGAIVGNLPGLAIASSSGIAGGSILGGAISAISKSRKTSQVDSEKLSESEEN